MRVIETGEYAETRDALSRDWILRLNAWEMTPLPVPNGLGDPAAYLASIAPNLIVLTGGGDPGEPADRAATENAALAYSAESGTPVLGICRGMQVINKHFGGALSRVEGHVG